jgi:hypothetical protein
VAANQRFEDAVAAEGHKGAVVGMWSVVEDIVGGEAVVEVRGVVLWWKVLLLVTGSCCVESALRGR